MFQRRENSYVRLLNVVCGGCLLCAAIPLGFLLILSALYGTAMSVCIPAFGLLEFVSLQNATSVAGACYDSLVYRIVQIHYDAAGTHLTFLVNLLITLGTLVGMVLTNGAPFFLSYLIIQCATEGMYEKDAEVDGEQLKHCDEAKQEHQL
jgi:phosphotransferase system  glucose/maltose/N-acetylglucosamine-specific IIC component